MDFPTRENLSCSRVELLNIVVNVSELTFGLLLTETYCPPADDASLRLRRNERPTGRVSSFSGRLVLLIYYHIQI